MRGYERDLVRNASDSEDHLRRIALAVERIADALEAQNQPDEVVMRPAVPSALDLLDGPKSPVDVLAEALPDALNTTEDLPEDCTPEQVFRAAAEALFPTVRMLLEDEITSRYHPEFGTEYQEQEAPGSEEAAARPEEGFCRHGELPNPRDPCPDPVIRRVDKYSVEVDGVRVTASPAQEAGLREMTPEQVRRFVRIMDGAP